MLQNGSSRVSSSGPYKQYDVGGGGAGAGGPATGFGLVGPAGGSGNVTVGAASGSTGAPRGTAPRTFRAG